MDRIALDVTLLLRTGLPPATLRPEAVLAARVVEVQAGRALLSIAGDLVEATVPEEVAAGQTLRLRVEEVSAERVVLRHEPPPAAPLPAAQVPLPGGGRATIRAGEREGGGQRPPGAGGPPVPSVALRWESPVLGALDLRLELHPDEVVAAVTVGAGAPAQAARADAAALREALEAATGRPARLALTERRDPLDLYA